MKHVIQIVVMATDLLLMAAGGVLLYSCFITKNPFLWFVSIIILCGAYRTWKDQGGFMAWTKEGRSSFYDNWDEITKGN